MCGVISTFSIPQSGCSDGSGSRSNTSSAAPAISPCSSAATRSSSRAVIPRPMLMKQADRFIARKRAAFHIPSVSGVCGTVVTTKSASGSRASSCAGGMISAGASCSGRGSTPITRAPNAAQSRAVSAPMPPTPLISTVASARFT